MKPDRDMDPPDQYNRRSVKVVSDLNSFLRKLNPLKTDHKTCPECREVYESDLIHECPEESTDTDDSMYNDPRRGQAKDINR